MSDVRKALEQTIYTEYESLHGKPMFPPECEGFASIILERFDVTLKPVIGNAELGSYVRTADGAGATNDQKGERMLTYLTESGFRIVRVDDES